MNLFEPFRAISGQMHAIIQSAVELLIDRKAQRMYFHSAAEPASAEIDVVAFQAFGNMSNPKPLITRTTKMFLPPLSPSFPQGRTSFL